MRLSCAFTVNELPIAYRMCIVSVIKECLRLSDETYFKRLYGNAAKTKPFAFAPYLRNFHIQEDKFVLDELRVTVSSPDHQFLLHLYNGLHKQKQFSYRKYRLTRKSVNVLPETPIDSPSIICRTQSPLLIEDELGKPLAPTSPEYGFHFNYISDLILKGYRGQGLQTQLEMTPLGMKKVVIKESNHEFEASFGANQYLFYTGFQGLFKLTGALEDLRALYQLGASKRRNQGFGLFNIV